MANRAEIEILDEYLNDVRYRCIRDVFTDQGLHENRPVYLITKYIMGKPNGLDAMRLCRDIDQICAIVEHINKIYGETSDIDVAYDIYSIINKTNNNCPSPYVSIKNKLKPYLQKPNLNINNITTCIQSLIATNHNAKSFENLQILLKILQSFQESHLKQILIENNQQLWF